MASEGKNYQTEQRAQFGIVATAIVVGGGLFVMLLVSVMIVEMKFSSIRTQANIALGSFFLQCAAFTVLLIMPALTALGARSSLGRRSR
jgi:hypothetical protein